jgi:hypothetical protein
MYLKEISRGSGSLGLHLSGMTCWGRDSLPEAWEPGGATANSTRSPVKWASRNGPTRFEIAQRRCQMQLGAPQWSQVARNPGDVVFDD